MMTETMGTNFGENTQTMEHVTENPNTDTCDTSTPAPQVQAPNSLILTNKSERESE